MSTRQQAAQAAATIGRDAAVPILDADQTIVLGRAVGENPDTYVVWLRPSTVVLDRIDGLDRARTAARAAAEALHLDYQEEPGVGIG